jgi:AraC family transcriptional regulator, transcriptional activator of pobA
MSQKIYIPAFGLYGEGHLFPEILHVERILDRAEGHSWKIAPHRHPHLHQFLIIRKGHAELKIDGKTATIGQNWLVNIPPWAVHGFTFSPGTEGLVISLPVVEFSELFETNPTGSNLKHWQTCEIDLQLNTAAELLYETYQSVSFARAVTLRSLGTFIGTLVAGALKPHNETAREFVSDGLVPRFEALVRARFRERLKLTDYATALAVSPSHLSRMSRQITGTSATRFVESVVFKEACNQLAYTRTPISRIGYDLGFDDAAYFSRAFRKHTGLSPGAYRKSTNLGQ